MKKKVFCIVMAIVLLFNLSVVFATENVTMTDSVEDVSEEQLLIGILGTNQYIDKNHTVAEEIAELSDTDVNGNLTIFAKDITLKNITVNGDVAIFGENIDISSLTVMNGATVIAGQKITLNNLTSSGNLYTACEELKATANVKDLYAAAGSIELGTESQILKVYSYASDLVIEGGSYDVVLVSVDELSVGPNTIINQTLKYTSENEGKIDPSAQVANVEFSQAEEYVEKVETTADIIKEKVYNIVSLVIKTAIICGFIFMFVEGFVNKAKTDNIVKYISLSTLKGLGWAILIPVIAIALIFPVVTIGVSFASIAIYVIIFWASTSFVSIAIMNTITKDMSENKWKKYAITLGVAAVIGVLGQIPGIGGVVTFVVASAGMGIFFNSLKRDKIEKNETSNEVVEEKVEEESSKDE